MRHQGCFRFARPLHRPVLHRCHTLRNFRCGNDLPVPLGGTLPRSRLVRGGRGCGLPRNPVRRLHLGIQKRCFGVGLKTRILSAFVLFTSVTLLDAAPMLRLVTSVVGPVPVAAGGSAPPQTVESYNAGDGSLSLTVTVPSSVTWLVPSVGSVRACTSTTAAATCIPLQFALNTSALAAGTYTGTGTVIAGSNTIDAPQTITVTVRVGPVDVYVAPGTSSDLHITTNHAIATSSTTQDGNRWLSLVLEGTGSFRFSY